MSAKAKQIIFRFLIGIGVIIALYVIVVQHVFRVSAESMAPNFQPGDHLFVNPLSYGIFGAKRSPGPGDLIMFTSPVNGQSYFKRVVAVAGDQVAYQNGHLVLNGARVERAVVGDRVFDETLTNGESYQIIELRDDAPFDTVEMVTVRDGAVFVLGDNRDNSLDSRGANGMGQIPVENVRGKVLWSF